MIRSANDGESYHNCLVCGKALVAVRSHRVTCSDRCRQVHSRRSRLVRHLVDAGIKPALAADFAKRRHAGRGLPIPPDQTGDVLPVGDKDRPDLFTGGWPTSEKQKANDLEKHASDKEVC